MSDSVMTPAQLQSDLIAQIQLDAAPWPADLDAAISAHEQYHNELALKELDGSDPILHPIRASVRPSVEPLLPVFEAQLAAAKNAAGPPGPTAHETAQMSGQNRLAGSDYEGHPYHDEYVALMKVMAQRGTMTERGFAQAKADIAANRKAAIDAAFGKVREKLDEAEKNVLAQQASTRVKPKAEDVEAAINLSLQLGITSPAHGASILAEWIADAAKSKASAKVAAALPMLKSRFEGDGPWHGSSELRELILKAERLTKTWQGTVTAARLERIKRTRYELSQYEQEIASGVSFEFTNGSRLFDWEPEPKRRTYEPPTKPAAPRKPVRFLRASEGKAVDKNRKPVKLRREA